MDRWWERPVNPATATYSLNQGEQDCTYHRVCCHVAADEQLFGLYKSSHKALTT